MHLPERFNDIEPETVYETCWTSRMPLSAPAKVGQVHLVTRETFPRTLCGLVTPSARLRFFPSPDDKRCTRCAKKAAA